MPKRIVTVEVSRYLSTPRLAPFLAEAQGDRELALALYQWNVQLAAAFQEVLALVEIVIRNAIDEQLRIWNVTRGNDPNGVPYDPEWTLRPATPLKGLMRDALTQANKHAERARSGRESTHPRKHAPICHDDMLAQLSFSVWKKLLPSADPNSAGLRNLWNNALVHAFPSAAAGHVSAIIATPAETVIHDRLDRVVKLRNRVAHMENLLQVNVSARLSDCLSLLAYVSPSTRDWCAGNSRVTEVNAARPSL